MARRSITPIRGTLLAAVLSLLVVGLATPALGQYPTPPPPEVEPRVIERDEPAPRPEVEPVVEAERVVQPAPRPLAITGANLILFVAVAIGLAGVGLLMLRAGRRRRKA